MSQQDRPRRFRGLPATGVGFLIAGGALVAISWVTGSGVWGYVGWVVVVASAVLVIIGLVARGAER
jgi:hypothetical protein